jgi:hypothetical protein
MASITYKVKQLSTQYHLDLCTCNYLFFWVGHLKFQSRSIFVVQRFVFQRSCVYSTLHFDECFMFHLDSTREMPDYAQNMKLRRVYRLMDKFIEINIVLVFRQMLIFLQQIF